MSLISLFNTCKSANQVALEPKHKEKNITTKIKISIRKLARFQKNKRELNCLRNEIIIHQQHAQEVNKSLLKMKTIMEKKITGPKDSYIFNKELRKSIFLTQFLFFITPSKGDKNDSIM